MPLPVLSPAACATLVAELAGWPAVAAAPAGEGVTELRADGVAFARTGPAGVVLQLPPRVRDMLVETGRAQALADPRQALLVPGAGEPVDLDLLRLAWERARIAARVQQAEG